MTTTAPTLKPLRPALSDADVRRIVTGLTRRVQDLERRLFRAEEEAESLASRVAELEDRVGEVEEA